MPDFRDMIPGTQISASQPSLAGLQAAMASGALSSAALTGFYLQRIDRLNPALHAVGTETDGSIVCPASACGIVGIKPTNGLVSRRGIVPISPVQDTAGPMGTCVADAAALLSVLAAADPEDPVSETENDLAERAGFDLSAASFSLALDGAGLEGARLGVWREGSAAAGPATAAVLEEAVARLRSLGA